MFLGITKSNLGAWLCALVRQADKPLSLAVFEAPDRIPDYKVLLPYALECAFRAGVGQELGGWGPSPLSAIVAARNAAASRTVAGDGTGTLTRVIMSILLL